MTCNDAQRRLAITTAEQYCCCFLLKKMHEVGFRGRCRAFREGSFQVINHSAVVQSNYSQMSPDVEVGRVQDGTVLWGLHTGGLSGKPPSVHRV